MSYETFELIDRLRASGTRAAMATLVRTIGTSPRKEGAKMFVGGDGRIFGSVTIGGCVEARVLEQSADVLQTSKPRLLNLKLGNEEAWEIGLSCSGAVDVFVEAFNDDIAQLYREAREQWDLGKPVAIATILSSGARFLWRDELPAQSGTITVDDGDVYVEVLRPPSRLMIFGGGAVAVPLVAFAKQVGFHTTLIDSRPQFANRDRFHDVDDIRVGIVSEITQHLNLGPSTPVVLVAHDHKIDVPVLKQALASDSPYIGLLGSRRRGAAILERLREEGLTDEQLARIHVPVGLDIGAETTAEIALSIVAEMLAVMRGRNGGSLRART